MYKLSRIVIDNRETKEIDKLSKSKIVYDKHWKFKWQRHLP